MFDPKFLGLLRLVLAQIKFFFGRVCRTSRKVTVKRFVFLVMGRGMRLIYSFFKPTEAKKFVTDAPKVIECRFCVEKFASNQGLDSHVKAKHNTPETRQHRSLSGTVTIIAGTLQVVSRVRHEQYLTFRIAGGHRCSY